MALSAVADEYFRTMNPLATKIHEDISETKNAYENIWDTLTEKEQNEIINESIIKPEIALKYALLDTLDFDLNDPPIRRDDLMSFFGKDHGQKVIQEDNATWRDEHSAPFLYQTKSQLNLCVLSEHRVKEDPGSSPPVLTELAMSHSKVVSELKNALKSQDILKATYKDAISSPNNFISKFMGNFKAKDCDDEEKLMPDELKSYIAGSSDNFFMSAFRSPPSDSKFEKEHRSSIVKSTSDVSEENRGLLSQASSGTDFHSCEQSPDYTKSTETLAPILSRSGFEFLDNW